MKKSLVGLDSEADGGEKETEEAVPAVEIISEFNQPKVCLCNNAGTCTTFQDGEVNT